eukprot:119485-Chlamydomonas_euryale.AAC.2
MRCPGRLGLCCVHSHTCRCGHGWKVGRSGLPSSPSLPRGLPMPNWLCFKGLCGVCKRPTVRLAAEGAVRRRAPAMMRRAFCVTGGG